MRVDVSQYADYIEFMMSSPLSGYPPSNCDTWMVNAEREAAATYEQVRTKVIEFCDAVIR